MSGTVIPFRRRRCSRAVAMADPVSAGRAALHAELTTDRTSPDSCPCPKCRDHPHTPAEADAALEHISDADTQLYAAKALCINGYEMCDECGAWVPTFVDPTPRGH